MSRMIRLLVFGFALQFVFLTAAGCSSSSFNMAEMVIELTLPDDFQWSAMPATIDDPMQLTGKLGQDGTDLLEQDWRSSTYGQLTSDKAIIKIAVHQFASNKGAAAILTAHKYPEAQQLKIGQEAYRWLDRGSAEAIFFRRDAYLAQLTANRHMETVLQFLAHELDDSLAGRAFPF